MSSIENLFDEHRLIERVVDAMASFTSEVQTDCEHGRCELMRLLTFFREYADLLHHEKEEELLMPALTEAGIRWDDGLLAQIRKDHEFERHLLQTLRHAALQVGEWSPDQCRRINEISQRFVQFMRGHIAREEQQLLPELQSKLSGDVRERVEERLERFDQKHNANGEVRLLVELGEELAARYASSK
jgi:hemerythrin-like domain-containing protein